MTELFAKSLGQVAYEAYVRHCGGKSVHGEDLPSWDGQDPVIQEHWEFAADAVAVVENGRKVA